MAALVITQLTNLTTLEWQADDRHDWPNMMKMFEKMVISQAKNPFSNLTTVVLQKEHSCYDQVDPELSVTVLNFFLALPSIRTIHARYINFSDLNESTMLLPKTSNVRNISFQGGYIFAEHLERIIACPRNLQSLTTNVFHIHDPHDFHEVWGFLESHAAETLQELTLRTVSIDAYLGTWTHLPNVRCLRTELAMFLPYNIPSPDALQVLPCQELELYEDDVVYHLSALQTLADVVSAEKNILPDLERLKLNLCQDSWQRLDDKEERRHLLDELVWCCKVKHIEIVLKFSLTAQTMEDQYPYARRYRFNLFLMEEF